MVGFAAVLVRPCLGGSKGRVGEEMPWLQSKKYFTSKKYHNKKIFHIFNFNPHEKSFLKFLPKILAPDKPTLITQ